MSLFPHFDLFLLLDAVSDSMEIKALEISANILCGVR